MDETPNHAVDDEGRNRQAGDDENEDLTGRASPSGWQATQNPTRPGRGEDDDADDDDETKDHPPTRAVAAGGTPSLNSYAGTTSGAAMQVDPSGSGRPRSRTGTRPGTASSTMKTCKQCGASFESREKREQHNRKNHGRM